jgi:hypothetical protein
MRCTHKVQIYETHTHEMHAREIQAYKVQVYETRTCEIHAHKVPAYETHA